MKYIDEEMSRYISDLKNKIVCKGLEGSPGVAVHCYCLSRLIGLSIIFARTVLLRSAASIAI